MRDETSYLANGVKLQRRINNAGDESVAAIIDGHIFATSRRNASRPIWEYNLEQMYEVSPLYPYHDHAYILKLILALQTLAGHTQPALSPSTGNPVR